MVARVRGNPVSYEEGLAHLRKFAGTVGIYRNAASLLMEEDGLYYVYDCPSEPCYGFLRTYGKGSTRPNDPRPGDLPRDFPDGTPVALAVPFPQIKDHTTTKEYWDMYFSGFLSPYREALKQAELIDNDIQYLGIVFLDTDVDSSVLIQFLRVTRYATSENYYKLKTVLPDEKPEDLFKISLCISSNGTPRAPHAPLKKYLDGEFLPDVTGGTFRNRYAYNRPEIDYIFGRPLDEENFTKRVQTKTKPNPNGYPVFKYNLETTLAVYKEMMNGK